FRKIQMAGTYAIHLPISSEVNMSFGTRLGISNNTFIREKAVVLNTSDPYQSYAGGDNTYDNFTANSSSKYMMDLGMGLYLYSNDFFVGFAADHLTRDLVEFGSGTANFNTQMHFNVMGGVKIPLNENLSLTPAFVAKYMWPAPPEIEGSLQLEYKKWLWGGMSYRHKDAVIAMFGMNLSETFKFGYSYDFTTSKMSNVSAGGHELVLGIMFR
ncbi:MAG: type IX secretion system membrane protein PorP/SprF, partial [Bacteroidetes bacterium]